MKHTTKLNVHMSELLLHNIEEEVKRINKETKVYPTVTISSWMRDAAIKALETK